MQESDTKLNKLLSLKILIGITAICFMIAVIYFLDKWDNKK